MCLFGFLSRQGNQREIHNAIEIFMAKLKL
jgi:hypothetical protein